MKRMDKQAALNKAVKRALLEDRAFEDVTSRSLIPPAQKARAKIIAKNEGVLAGVEAAREAFKLLDDGLRVKCLVADGQPLRKNQPVLEAAGSLRSILSAERTALNFLTHLSGIATLTRRFVRAAGPGGPRILDTRKTIPGLRDLEKAAVRAGGGFSHRRDLSQAVLIKENHLSLVQRPEDVRNLRAKIRGFQRRGLTVEMECQNRHHALWGLLCRADILLLDNFSPARLKSIVRWVDGFCGRKNMKRPLLEVSGNVSLETVPAIARAGVDRVSVGKITHSAPALDMSLDVEIWPVGPSSARRPGK